ncbi:MAG: 50S ribosomal protein L32 [Synergistetes bacterium]|nr:50S ribosomal protein L32 [Synergistota bacterium]MDK2871216.1 large subunit ribosomal protein [bacterium]
MAVPKRKTSRARRDRRFAQWLRRIKTPTLSVCSHCGEIIPAYRVCPECGYYKGREVIVQKEEEEE